MEQIIVKIEKFDIVRFIKDALERNEPIFNYPYSIHWGNLVDFFYAKYLFEGTVTEHWSMGKEFKIKDTFEFLKKDVENFVYVNFSNYYENGVLTYCIDGNEYDDGKYSSEAEVNDEENTENDNKESDELEYGVFHHGFIIQYKDGKYIINSGIYDIGETSCCSPTSGEEIRVCDCGVFDEPMKEYLNKYL